MKNLIEYLLLFVMSLIFCPNNYWTIIYCILFALTYISFTIVYFIKKKKSDEKPMQISLDFVIISSMIVAVNIIAKVELVNLVFGFTLCIIVLVSLIRNLMNKTNLEEEIIKPSRIFDYYSLVYMASLIMMIINYEI